MGLTRRALLQQAGLTLTAFGFSEVGLSLLADRYQQALAAPTRRKLALLVGINQYPEQVCDYVPSRGSALNGCLTDVALQQELLVYRFGFQPSDILTLTDQQATRQAIELAFRTHLTEQVRAEDVVVIHFSGLGSQVKLTDSPEHTQRSFVPIDGVLPTAENPAVNDLLEETLGLLLRSLPTDQITTVLDLSYSEPSRTVQGVRVRSRPSTPMGQLDEAERVLQELLLAQLKPSREQQTKRSQSGRLPGIVLSAADTNQGAIEGQWSGFSAGLFTYALTQQLWQTTPQTTLQVSLSQTTATINQFVGQEQHPQLGGQKSQQQKLSPYNLDPISTAGADGVITAVEEDGKTVQVWLGGVPALVLEYYGGNSLLSLNPFSKEDSAVSEPSPDSQVLLQGRSRDGLILRARLTEPATGITPQVGQFIYETVRVLPRNISLVVALDNSLERIERVDATSAFAAISKVSAVIAGGQPADYLFGKTLPAAQSWATSVSMGGLSGGALIAANPNSSVKEGYGLFNLGRAAVPNTLTGGEEAVKTAINRLTPKLRVLLAAKLLRLTSNSHSSQLGVKATLEMVAPQERIIAQRQTLRASASLIDSKLDSKSTHLLAEDDDIPTMPIGSRIRYRLYNYSDRPVYFTALGLDSSGYAVALYSSTAPDANAGASEANVGNAIAPGETLIIPQPATPDWVVSGPSGAGEIHFIFSRAPLSESTAILSANTPPGSPYGIAPLTNSLDTIHAVLRDLHQASTAISVKADAPIDTYMLDVAAWATLSFVYRVADA